MEGGKDEWLYVRQRKLERNKDSDDEWLYRNTIFITFTVFQIFSLFCTCVESEKTRKFPMFQEAQPEAN